MTTHNNDDNDWLTTKEAQDLFKLAARTLQRYKNSGKVETRQRREKHGLQTYYRRSDLERLQAEQGSYEVKAPTLAPREEAPPHGQAALVPTAPPTQSLALGEKFLEILEAATGNSPKVRIAEKIILNLDDAAELTSFSKSYLLGEIKAGRLKAKKAGRGWHVTREALEAWKRNHWPTD